MKPNSPLHLARLLDQVRGLYPNGIPVSALVSKASSEVSPEPFTRYHFFVVGQRELSPASAELLEGIAKKGLRLSSDEYRISFVSESEVSTEVGGCASERAIVFGCDGRQQLQEHCLVTHSLEELSSDPALKRELWRSLQTFLTPP
jgi:hypothetical protein